MTVCSNAGHVSLSLHSSTKASHVGGLRSSSPAVALSLTCLLQVPAYEDYAMWCFYVVFMSGTCGLNNLASHIYTHKHAH